MHNGGSDSLPTAHGPRIRLSMMMFLEFFIWGAWFELNFDYVRSLGFVSWQQSLVFGAFNLAALVALFFGTQFVDRNFAAEKFLAFSQFVGGLGMLGLFWVGQGWKTELAGLEINLSFWAFFLFMLLHCLFYVPTISITNSIAFANLKDPQRDFGLIRVWGTIGWIVASWPFIFILVDWDRVTPRTEAYMVKQVDEDWRTITFADQKGGEQTHTLSSDAVIWIRGSKKKLTDVSTEQPAAVKLDSEGKVVALSQEATFFQWLGQMLGTAKTGDAFREGSRYIFLVAGIASLVMALFSMTLPHTPPKLAAAGAERLAWLEAMRLLKYPFILVLFLVTFLDAAVHQTFFYWTVTYLKQIEIPGNWASPVMKIGQVAEILTMIFLGYVLKNLGWRWTMVFGILGHAARFAVFAYYPEPWAAVAINVVHGICYAFFFATVYIFVDEFFPKDARSSAQGLFNFLIVGMGPFVANLVLPQLGEIYATAFDAEGQPTKFDFHEIFQYPLITALAAALMLLLFFFPPKKKAAEETPTAP